MYHWPWEHAGWCEATPLRPLGYHSVEDEGSGSLGTQSASSLVEAFGIVADWVYHEVLVWLAAIEAWSAGHEQCWH